jgi:NADH-quinone oxidoreductase subunit N
MSAPLVWIGLPIIFAIASWFIPFRRTIIVYFSAAFCLSLVILTWAIPVGSPFFLGPLQFEFSPTLILLGRRFVIDSQDMPMIALIYLIGTVWNLSAGILYSYRSFSSIGVGILALLVAALSVEPFLYAALLIEAAVLISVPMLIPPGQRESQGVMRYVIYQTLALPFILIAGWVAGGVEANPADVILLQQAVLLLGLGFALLLAVFPFYFWMPLLCSEIHPFLMGFILSILPTIILLLAMEFLNTYIWLRNFELLSSALSIAGLIMVITAGVLSAFQRDLRRLFGYAVVMENGFSLLALGLGSRVGMEILVISLVPRLIGLWVWASAITVLFGSNQSITLENSRGLVQRYPFATGALMLAYFSISGLPLLPGFPIRQALLINLSQINLIYCLGVMLGMLGFLLSGFRLLMVLMRIENTSWTMSENWQQVSLLTGGTLLLAVNGLFPNWLSLGILEILRAFEHLI